MYQYLNESLSVLSTIWRCTLSGDLLIAIFCSEKEGLRREKVVELCFIKDSLAFVKSQYLQWKN